MSICLPTYRTTICACTCVHYCLSDNCIGACASLPCILPTRSESNIQLKSDALSAIHTRAEVSSPGQHHQVQPSAMPQPPQQLQQPAGSPLQPQLPLSTQAADVPCGHASGQKSPTTALPRNPTVVAQQLGARAAPTAYAAASRSSDVTDAAYIDQLPWDYRQMPFHVDPPARWPAGESWHPLTDCNIVPLQSADSELISTY